MFPGVLLRPTMVPAPLAASLPMTARPPALANLPVASRGAELAMLERSASVYCPSPAFTAPVGFEPDIESPAAVRA